MNKLQKKNFSLFILGQLVSVLGSGIQMIALPLFILDLTGSGAKMGLFATISMVPALITSPFAGVLGDRLNRKYIMILMDYVRGFIILFLAILTFYGKMSISILFISQVFISIFDSLFESSTVAMIPDLVGKEDLMRASSLSQSFISTSKILGPVLGGVIYGLFGMKWIFIINGLSFIFSAFSEMFITYKKTTNLSSKINFNVIFKDLKASVIYIFKNNSLKNLMFFAIILNFLLNPLFVVLIPYTFRKVVGFSAQQYGLLETTWTIGILLGNLILGIFFSKNSKSSNNLLKYGFLGMVSFNLIFSFFLIPKSINTFSIWQMFFISGSILCLMGISNAFVNTPIGVYFQKIIPNEQRSKIFSVIGVLFQIATPFGMIIIGYLVDGVPVHWIFISISFIILLISILFLKKLSTMNFE
ncbi:permease [Tepiditoga spiralis]|uniref:Permease n=1 Tax=Tepiditoga spiralis TaxID=2108365 RepID=A0A7G1GC18_9BACT|nr:MFS transporter [Tepiditoga spiralis]BBE31609.1 permease [Tepiditoga spiralis]